MTKRPDRPTRSTEELARAAQAGSSEAFGALVEAFGERLFAFLRLRVGGDPLEAEELVQETFVRAWTHLARYDAERSFQTWLFTLAKHLAVSRWRRRRARPFETVPERDLGQGTEPVHHLSPERLAAARDEEQNLWRTAERVLTPDQRSALWLLFVEEFSTEEVARILGKRPSTVRVLVFRARRQLANELPAHAPSRPAASVPPPVSLLPASLAEGNR